MRLNKASDTSDCMENAYTGFNSSVMGASAQVNFPFHVNIKLPKLKTYRLPQKQKALAADADEKVRE